MNQNENRKQEEQEVDLVPVFVWIGDGIKGFFRAIGNFFKAIGHAFILFLIFLQKNIILIGAFVVLGIVLGYYMESASKGSYSAQLRVQPNFNSASQLISNINYYRALASEEDYDRLAQELGITTQEAEELGSFKIEPSYNDTELLEEYDQLARSSDTMALDNFTFEGFKDAKREFDYEFYEITAKAKSRAVLEKIIPQLVDIRENAGIKASRVATTETVNFDLKAMEYQLQELDSLIAAYQIMIKTGQNKSGNTNVYMNDQESSDNLRNLFLQKQSLLYSMENLREDKYRSENIVNIVSEYVVKGNVKNQYTMLKWVLILFVLGVLVAFIPVLWRFLKSYSQQVS